MNDLKISHREDVITVNTTFDEIRNMFGKLSEYMHFIQPTEKGVPVTCKIKEYCGYQSEETASGLNMMREQLDAGTGFFTDVYTEEQMQKSEDRRETQLSFFPGRKEEALVLIIPGGGYHKVCTMLEGVPIAYKMWTYGYNVALLNYRVEQNGIMPKPMEDVAAALGWIQERQEELGVSLDNYMVIGFSAGGHLAAEWGTTNEGYAKYHFPAPKMLLLGYPGTAIYLFDEMLKMQSEQNAEKIEIAKEFLQKMLGENYTEEDLRRYSTDLQVDEKYPPTFLIHSKDDGLVPYEGSVNMLKSLKKFKIPYKFVSLDKSGHGFALWLNGTVESKDWIENALDFWRGL